MTAAYRGQLDRTRPLPGRRHPDRPGALTVTAASSDTTLLATSGLVLGGSGANRTVTATPAAGRTGIATVTLTVSDGALSATTTFRLTVTLSPRSIPGLTATATGTTVVVAWDPVPGHDGTYLVSLDGGVANRETSTHSTFRDVPVGSHVVGVRTENPDGPPTTTTVVVGTPTPPPAAVAVAATPPPTVSAIANATNPEDVPEGPIAFTVGDAETSPGALVVTATSSDQTLVPASGLTLAGTGTNRTLTITPAAIGTARRPSRCRSATGRPPRAPRSCRASPP